VTSLTRSHKFANEFTKKRASDAFIAKLNPAGSAPIYLTYLGGSRLDGGTGITVDPGGAVCITGSADFPTTNPLQSTFGGGSFESFVAKLTASGSALEYSTYLGGTFDSHRLIRARIRP